MAKFYTNLARSAGIKVAIGKRRLQARPEDARKLIVVSQTVKDLFALERFITTNRFFQPVLYIEIEGIKTPGKFLSKPECEDYAFPVPKGAKKQRPMP